MNNIKPNNIKPDNTPNVSGDDINIKDTSTITIQKMQVKAIKKIPKIFLIFIFFYFKLIFVFS